jgi:hypothetical protein
MLYLISDADDEKLCQDFVDGAHDGWRLSSGQAQQSSFQQGKTGLHGFQSNWKKY